MEKYYTPSVDEFHNGFRYEESKSAIATASTEWYKFEYDIESELPRNCEFRVKYLDKSDIEELGWIYKGKHHAYKEDDWFEISRDKYTSYYLLIQYGMPNFSIMLDAKGGFSIDSCIFNGNIKNYNELKKIMEQLGIINN